MTSEAPRLSVDGRPVVASAASDRGAVMAIGGAEDKFRQRVILTAFAELAGGSDARIVIIPSASSIESAGQRYKALFLEMGVASAEVVYLANRDEANADGPIARLADATGIFLTGGNQMRLKAIIAGTRTDRMIRRRNEEGAVVAGTSAGASILSSHMVAFGASGETPKQRMAHLAAGLGLVPEVIIDQHFQERNRLGRLLALIAANPGLLGVGVDEDTAAIVRNDGTLEVIGRGSVTIVDGSEMYSDVYQVKGHKAITVSGARLHVLAEGRRFDLRARRLLNGDYPVVKEPPMRRRGTSR